MSLVSLAGHLSAAAKSLDRALEGGHAFEQACVILKTEIQAAIGTNPYGWPPLAASTVERKGSDAILLDKGEYKASFTYVLGHHEAWVGTSDWRATWLEHGTSRMPPRPVLPGAWNAKEAEVRACFSGIIKVAFEGG